MLNRAFIEINRNLVKKDEFDVFFEKVNKTDIVISEIINDKSQDSLLIGFNIGGRILLSCTGLKINTNKIDIVSTILGLLISIFIYAAYLTGFKTVLWGIPIIIILIWLFYYENNKIKFNKEFLNKWNFRTHFHVLIEKSIWPIFYYVQFFE